MKWCSLWAWWVSFSLAVKELKGRTNLKHNSGREKCQAPQTELRRAFDRGEETHTCNRHTEKKVRKHTLCKTEAEKSSLLWGSKASLIESASLKEARMIDWPRTVDWTYPNPVLNLLSLSISREPASGRQKRSGFVSSLKVEEEAGHLGDSHFSYLVTARSPSVYLPGSLTPTLADYSCF